MLGLFGSSLIGTDNFTGPTSDAETSSARFARHELVRGKPALQDLGDDARTKSLNFFFDETFCDPETELLKITLAFKSRTPMKLFFDLQSFEVGTFVIERLSVQRQKTSKSGRVVRLEIEVELIESSLNLGGVIGAAVGRARALINPILRRG